MAAKGPGIPRVLLYKPVENLCFDIDLDREILNPLYTRKENGSGPRLPIESTMPMLVSNKPPSQRQHCHRSGSERFHQYADPDLFPPERTAP